jgi:O-antigen/teichoic acid export membrane protein
MVSSLKNRLTLKRFFSLFTDENLTKKASLNVLGAMLEYGARMVVGLLINPYLVSGLGDYLYGVLQILGRSILYMSAASGRPTQALKWIIAQQQSSVDFEKKRRNVGSALVVWSIFVPILSVLGGLLVWLAPTWLDAPREVAWIVRVSAAIMSIDLVLTTFADIPQSTLQGENLSYKRMGSSTLIVLIAGGGFTAIALYFKTGLIGVVAADLAYTLVAGGFFLYLTKKTIPWFGIAKPSISEIRSFLRLSGWFLIWRLIDQLMISSDVIVLGQLLSVANVTTYTLAKYVPETLIGLVALVTSGISPGLGGVIGKRDYKKAGRIRDELMMGTWFISTIVGTTILLWDQNFIKLWVGQEYYASNIATLMIIVMVIQFVFIKNDASLIDLSLDLRYKVVVGTISAMLSILFATVFLWFFKWGIVGLCLGFIAGRIILSLGYPWFISRLLGMSFVSQLIGIVRPTIVMCLMFGSAVWMGKSWAVNDWISLILAVGFTIVFVALIAFYTGLSNKQRTSLLERISIALKLQSIN